MNSNARRLSNAATHIMADGADGFNGFGEAGKEFEARGSFAAALLARSADTRPDGATIAESRGVGVENRADSVRVSRMIPALAVCGRWRLRASLVFQADRCGPPVVG